MNARRPTIADVAREAGVSPSTASVVFSGKAPVSDATRGRVLEAASALGYFGPDPRAASLRRGRSGIIGVVGHGRLGNVFGDPVMRVTMDALADAVAPLGAGLLLLREASVVSGEPTLLTAPIDAAVLFGCGTLLRDHLASVRARGIPIVVIEGDGGAGVPQIALDNREAQRRAAEHVRDLGHHRVVTVTMPTRWGAEPGWLSAQDERTVVVDVTADRLAGFRDVYPDAAAYAALDSTIDAGVAAGREILAGIGGRAGVAAGMPTAIVAQTDLLAAGILRAAEEAGLRVPVDLSVTGFDGVAMDGLAPFELTTLVQPAAEKGRAAGETVAALLAGESAPSRSLTSMFRIGNTTARVHSRF